MIDIWTNISVDSDRKFYETYAKNNDCKYLDFNLLKDRADYFSDKTSFKDHYHLSESGSLSFMRCLCRVLKTIDSGQEVSNMFYNSYAEAVEHFEYYDIYQKAIREN